MCLAGSSTSNRSVVFSMPKAYETETTLEWLKPSLKRSGTHAGSLCYFGLPTIGRKE
jgi:hypothetical protein